MSALWEEDYSNTLTSYSFSTSQNTIQFTNLYGKPNYDTQVSFPALNSVPSSSMDTGINIKDSSISLSSNGGWFKLPNNGQNFTTQMISTVDCSNCGANCHTCHRSPWYELHFIFFSDSAEAAGFGIYYIYPTNKTFVQLNYTLTVPTLATPAVTYQAKWSGQLNGGSMKTPSNLFV